VQLAKGLEGRRGFSSMGLHCTCMLSYLQQDSHNKFVFMNGCFPKRIEHLVSEPGIARACYSVGEK
jgi:hypothetical protein